MSNSLLNHALSIRGFDHQRWDWSGKNRVTQHIVRKAGTFECAACRSRNVTATPVGERLVRASKIGRNNWILSVTFHRLRCHDCGAYRMERLPFLSEPHSHITRQLERMIIELRPEMSVSALAKYFELDWRTVKNVEKKCLRKNTRLFRLATSA